MLPTLYTCTNLQPCDLLVSVRLNVVYNKLIIVIYLFFSFYCSEPEMAQKVK